MCWKRFCCLDTRLRKHYLEPNAPNYLRRKFMNTRLPRLGLCRSPREAMFKTPSPPTWVNNVRPEFCDGLESSKIAMTGPEPLMFIELDFSDDVALQPSPELENTWKAFDQMMWIPGSYGKYYAFNWTYDPDHPNTVHVIIGE
jgi:hypothetical protein